MIGRGNAGRRSIASGTVIRPKQNRTQLLREAKAFAIAAIPEDNKDVRNKRVRTGLAKVGPPPTAPRRVDFTRPAPTRAMLARQAKAKADEERRQQQQEAAKSQKRVVTGRRQPCAKKSRAPAKVAEEAILEKSIQLAESGKAKVIEAMALKDGPIDTVVIPPGIAREDQSIIVCIKSYEEAAGGIDETKNQSIQALSRSLHEQETAEAGAVQSKLDEFQQARREFVMELASVAATPGFDPESSILDVDQMDLGPFDNVTSTPIRRRDPFMTRIIHPLPDPDHEIFHVSHGRNHPAIIAARDFLTRTANVGRHRSNQRDEDFFVQAARELSYSDDEFDLERSLMQDVDAAGISFEEDEDGEMMPCQSRIKASMPRIPRKSPGHRYDFADVDELERFFNIERYPGSPFRPSRPPLGRENLNPDLWELDDPWFREPPQSDFPDLMQFSSDSRDLMHFSS